MNVILILVLLGGFIGWVMESIIFYPKKPCDRSLKYLFGVCPPMLLIYSLGILILYLIHKYTNYSLLTKALLATIIIIFMECIVGLLAQKVHGYRTWEYKSLSFCNGYISIWVSGIWFILSLFVLWIFQKSK